MSHELLATLRDLQNRLTKAERYKEKWERKASDLAKRVEAYRLVAKDLGLLEQGEEAAPDPVSRTLVDAVRQTVARATGGDFTVHDVLDNLPPAVAGASRATVSSILIRMAGEGHLRRIEVGRGRIPTVYRATHDTLTEAQESEEDDGSGDVTPFRRAEGGG